MNFNEEYMPKSDYSNRRAKDRTILASGNDSRKNSKKFCKLKLNFKYKESLNDLREHQ